MDERSLIRNIQGLEIITAQDGMDALEKLAVQNVRLVITDLNMPRMNGLELILHG
ncbi:MAG: response regulator [bacterium]